MPNTTYNLMDDDATLFLVNYLFTKLKTSPLANVQGNWNETVTTSPAFIQNKPAIPANTSDLTNDSNFVADASYVHTDNNYTTADKTKLGGIAAGAQVNVQSDWSINDNTSDAFIKNKPSIPANTSDLTNDSNFVADASYVHTDNNYTTADKTKLGGIATGAEVNVIDAITLNGNTVTVTNKTAGITISMDLSDYSNATTGFQNATQVNAAIQAAIAGITGISFQRVNSYADLPVTGAAGTIYLVPNSGSAPNIYDEYIWCLIATSPETYGYEKIGTTAVDLSGYVQYTDISTLTNQEVTNIVDTAYTTVFGNS